MIPSLGRRNLKDQYMSDNDVIKSSFLRLFPSEININLCHIFKDLKAMLRGHVFVCENACL